MRKIAVMEDFLTPEHRKRVLAAAEKHGFAVDFYGRGKAPAEGLDQYEIIYGWCEPGDLKRATALKWYCCGFAGVDQLSDDSLYASLTWCCPTPPEPTASPSASTSSW